MFLEVDAVSVNFGGIAALKNVSFTVPEGTIVSVIGPNGAGKTTLFNIMTGFRRPTAGEVRLDHTVITKLAPHEIAHLGLVRTFQKTEVFPELSVSDCVRIGCLNGFRPTLFQVIVGSRHVATFRRDVEGRVERILATVGLGSKARYAARELSYGEQRRLEVAVGLAAQPRFLLMDEPSSGLNAEESLRFASLVRRLSSERITILLVEHNMSVVMGVSDKIVVLHHGEKIAEGTPGEITRNRAVIAAYLGREWVTDAVG